MIRIDLGKGDGERKERRFKLDLGRFGKLGGGRVGKVLGDLKSLVLIVVALAIAWLPHLFFEQFKAFVIEQHEASKRKLEESISVLNAEIAKLQPFQRELESYEQQKKLVRDRLEVVRALLANRGTPVNVLDAVGQSLPRRTWLTEMEFKGGMAQPSIKLTGQSYSNEDISDFLDKLSESVYFTDVKLEDMQPGRSTNTEVRQFRIAARPKMQVPLKSGNQPGTPGGNQ
jgi:Tfp pilus assembly protein PilN